uniref:hypothetical protein n=1 Tax=Herbidospora sakaeratensis TaxID=564415 RepID=UPI0012F78454|nr:hypothetical protein [Herbidospora sakaeratensis]
MILVHGRGVGPQRLGLQDVLGTVGLEPPEKLFPEFLDDAAGELVGRPQQHEQGQQSAAIGE